MSVANNGSIDITVCDPETHSPDDTPQSPERGPSHTPRSPGRSPAHRVRQFLSSRSPNKARQCRSLSPPAPASGRLKRYLSPYRTHQPPPRPHARRASSSNSRLAQLLQALLDNGIPEEVIRAKWQWHDCYGTGLLTEDQFVAWSPLVLRHLNPQPQGCFFFFTPQEHFFCCNKDISYPSGCSPRPTDFSAANRLFAGPLFFPLRNASCSPLGWP